MAFLVQNDNGTTAGANAYVTVAEFRTYHNDRGNDFSAYSLTDIEGAIVRATDYLDTRFTFVGYRTSLPQRTAWPRMDAEDADENDVSGTIPQEIKDACCEYAFIALSQILNPSPTYDDRGRLVQSKSETVGPISETTVYGGGGIVMPTYPAADRRLSASGLVIPPGTIWRA